MGLNLCFVCVTLGKTLPLSGLHVSDLYQIISKTLSASRILQSKKSTFTFIFQQIHLFQSAPRRR